MLCIRFGEQRLNKSSLKIRAVHEIISAQPPLISYYRHIFAGLENCVQHGPHGRRADAAVVVIGGLVQGVSLCRIAVNLVYSVGHLFGQRVSAVKQIFDIAHIRFLKLRLVDGKSLVGVYGNADFGESAFAAAHKVFEVGRLVDNIAVCALVCIFDQIVVIFHKGRERFVNVVLVVVFHPSGAQILNGFIEGVRGRSRGSVRHSLGFVFVLRGGGA